MNLEHNTIAADLDETLCAQESCKRKQLRRKLVKYAIITACGLVVFFIFSRSETARRGYFAVGGEGVFALLPLWWWIFERVIKDTTKGLL